MRLIDADKLKKDVLDLQDCYNGFSDTYDKACIIGVIDEQPSAQPERVNGKWINDGDPATWVCSNCGYRVKGYNNTKFCPNCGSDNRGDQQS